MKLRLGYACINLSLPWKFKTVQYRTLLKLANAGQWDDLELKLYDVWKHNVSLLGQIVQYNRICNIELYRLSSSLLPFSDYAHMQSTWLPINERLAWMAKKLLANLEYSEELTQCKAEISASLALRYRFTIHPGQFISLGSSNPGTVARSIAALKADADLLTMLGIPESHAAPINIHMQCQVSDTPALERWMKVFVDLPDNVTERLVVENDDKGGNTVEALIGAMGRYYSNLGMDFPNLPVTVDWHHQYVTGGLTPDWLESRDFERAKATWGSHTPLYHLSSSRPNSPIRAHSDYIDPNTLATRLALKAGGDIELEAKMKDVALLKLRKDLNEITHN